MKKSFAKEKVQKGKNKKKDRGKVSLKKGSAKQLLTPG
jgi:hypothetical protein